MVSRVVAMSWLASRPAHGGDYPTGQHGSAAAGNLDKLVAPFVVDLNGATFGVAFGAASCGVLAVKAFGLSHQGGHDAPPFDDPPSENSVMPFRAASAV